MVGNVEATVQSLLDAEKFGWRQWALFWLCFLIIAVDGFDTQVIAFTGPSIIKAFALTPAELGNVFVAGTVGMALGAMGFGLLGDRLGRRPTIIATVFAFGVFTLAVAYASSFNELIVLRFLTGLGIGGATPVVVALAAESVPSRLRAMVVSAAVSGLPIGAILGAMLAQRWMPVLGWQAMYLYGALAAFVVLGLCVLFLPESAALLVARDRNGDMARARALTARFLGRELPPEYRLVPSVRLGRASVGALFGAEYRRLTLGIWGGYLFNFLAWFGLIFWLPTVLVASGMPPAHAPLATMTLNLVATICIYPFAFILPRVGDVRRLLVALFAFGVLVCVALACCRGSEARGLTLGALAGIGVGLEQMGLYYLAARLYPEKLRATGIGWGVALGRVGAIGGGGFGSLFLQGGGVSGFYLGLVPPLVLALGAVLLIPAPAKAEAKSAAGATAAVPPRGGSS
jgi:AAHS family 4-hydroxybenzoate transporter-like MFS transporter